MSILGKYTDNLIEEEPNDNKSYTTPAVLREDKDELTLKKSIIISTILHPSVLGAAWLAFLILAFFGINFALFERPKPKMNDIEFVLVDREETPLNKNTPYRADINSRTGGVNDPTKKVSMPSPSPSQAKPAQSSAASTPSKSPKPAQQPKVTQPVKKAAPVAQPVQKKATQQARPQPPTARPSSKPPMTPKVAQRPSSAFKVPVPSGGTKSGSYSTGPISGSGSSNKGGSSGSYAPTPSLAPTGGSSSSGSRLAQGGGGGAGTGNIGNPGGGGGRPGIDAIREPDFGPYMRDLQRRIKMNWDPPKGNESKRVVLLFKIAKDGRLLSCSVFKSSGLPSADKAAMNAVQLTAPFRPLPAEFKGQSIDIQFTFDYNVFGASGYN